MIVLESIAVADVVLAVASAAIMLAGSLAFYALRKAWPDYQAQNERLRHVQHPERALILGCSGAQDRPDAGNHAVGAEATGPCSRTPAAARRGELTPQLRELPSVTGAIQPNHQTSNRSSFPPTGVFWARASS